MNTKKLLQCSLLMFTVCGVWLVALGIYFIFIRASLLPEDLRFIGVSDIEIQKSIPRLSQWLNHVFTVLGGFIAGCGVLVLFLTKNVLRHQFPGSTFALGITGLLTVGTMSWINFLIDSQFKWVLFVPALLWLLGIFSYSFSEHERDKSSYGRDYFL